MVRAVCANTSSLGPVFERGRCCSLGKGIKVAEAADGPSATARLCREKSDELGRFLSMACFKEGEEEGGVHEVKEALNELGGVRAESDTKFGE